MEKEQILELISPIFRAMEHLGDATENLVKIVKINAGTIEALEKTIRKLEIKIQELEEDDE